MINIFCIWPFFVSIAYDPTIFTTTTTTVGRVAQSV
jgi:hypothetical protein